MKTCKICLLPKSLDEFGNNTRFADGKHHTCRVCWNLYVNQRRWAHGRIPEVSFFDRLWNAVEMCAHGPICIYCCWKYTKGHDKDGYGHFTVTNAMGEQTVPPVTRVLYEVWNGIPIPDGYLVCHYCDNPSCPNPTHFWLGTSNDNRQDCVTKGRQAQKKRHGTYTRPEAFPRGEASLKAKLTEEQVLEIREKHAAGMSMYALSFLYSVSKFAILCVVKRRTWTHI